MSASKPNNVEIKLEGSSQPKAVPSQPSITSKKNTKRPSIQLHTVSLSKRVKIPDRPILLQIKHTYETEVIDLTDDDDIPLMADIRKNNELFFTYDPRGIWSDRDKPDYCSECGCPKNYCANTVFGKECMIRSEYILIGKKKCNVDKMDVLSTLSHVYSDAVQAKARTNMIVDIFEHECYESLLLPNCILEETASVLIKKVTDYKDKNDSIVWSPCKTKWMNKDNRIYKP